MEEEEIGYAHTDAAINYAHTDPNNPYAPYFLGTHTRCPWCGSPCGAVYLEGGEYKLCEDCGTMWKILK